MYSFVWYVFAHSPIVRSLIMLLSLSLVLSHALSLPIIPPIHPIATKQLEIVIFPSK